MARRRSIVDSLRENPDETTEPTESAPAPTEEPPAEPPNHLRPVESGPESAPERQKAPRRQTSRKPAKKAAETPSGPETGEKARPAVLTAASTGDAKRVGLYLHPDDFRALGMAKLDDGADANARIRAMIALWRGNDRYRAAVDRLARTAPRGPIR